MKDAFIPVIVFVAIALLTLSLHPRGREIVQAVYQFVAFIPKVVVILAVLAIVMLVCANWAAIAGAYNQVGGLADKAKFLGKFLP